MPLFQVIRGLAAGFGNGSSPGARMTTLADQVVCDFLQAMVLDGRGYQVRAGTVTTPLVGDVAITDTAAEMAADAATGTTIIPFSFRGTLDAQGGDAFEMAIKSVATASSSGTAFVPLPLLSGGSAAVSTARVEAAGAVTVTAELATTTLRHFESSREFVQDSAAESPVFVGELTWEPRAAPVLVGPRCFYVQIASATGGPSYFAHFDFIEGPTLLFVPS